MNFPVSVADFVANQERILGRPLFDHERKCLEVWTPIINDVYTDGLDTWLLELMDAFISRAKSPDVVHFLEAAKYWMQYADSSRKAATA